MSILQFVTVHRFRVQRSGLRTKQGIKDPKSFKNYPQRPLRLCGELFSISEFKLFGAKCLQVVPAKFIFADKCLGRNDVGHHFLIQGVYDGTQ
jgi:hypothetical protein